MHRQAGDPAHPPRSAELAPGVDLEELAAITLGLPAHLRNLGTRTLILRLPPRRAAAQEAHLGPATYASPTSGQREGAPRRRPRPRRRSPRCVGRPNPSRRAVGRPIPEPAMYERCTMPTETEGNSSEQGGLDRAPDQGKTGPHREERLVSPRAHNPNDVGPNPTPPPRKSWSRPIRTRASSSLGRPMYHDVPWSARRRRSTTIPSDYLARNSRSMKGRRPAPSELDTCAHSLRICQCQSVSSSVARERDSRGGRGHE